MTQRGRRRQRRRGSVGTKVAVVAGVVVALIVIAVIGVTTWVLNVAADAPSLASCDHTARHGNSVIYAANGERRQNLKNRGTGEESWSSPERLTSEGILL